MKKLISFSMFLAIVVIVVVAKTSQAQVAVKVIRISAPATIWVDGFWKWSPRYKRHVWVEGHWGCGTNPR